eukprot:CAMPEP_0178389212 /NCGR_PEP_ID=MMETSP0689_2-20121128/9995_1 /TAXON_ID=160604 /ORGANISM="Amphidinium massartii, Strain CS-259" /LENGTH=435 /DNA_ID=CAMNT_0020009645 /DNA_START=112 /DNA_END=1419 /DNA_ORIENTATION=+
MTQAVQQEPEASSKRSSRVGLRGTVSTAALGCLVLGRRMRRKNRGAVPLAALAAVQDRPPKVLHETPTANGEVTRATPSPHDAILRVAKGEVLERTPVWLMRQAGRYMKAFRDYSDYIPFRKRSETPSMAVELSLQCWQKYGMDGVIMFSDILTPLPAIGIDFDVVKGRGPVVPGDIKTNLEDMLKDNSIHTVDDPEDFEITHSFVRRTLQRLHRETDGNCCLLGFIGAPWTLAAYALEGGSTKGASHFKKWMYEKPEVVDEYLERVGKSLANYAIYQARSGAQCIQIFDSWAHCMTPSEWQRFAAPYVRSLAATVRAACPEVPLIYFANGGSSYLRDQVETLADCIDVLQVDQFMRMSEAVKIAEGSGMVLQGNIDPFVLRYGSEQDVREAVRRCIDEAGGPGRHILNLGHGVLQGTPEENVGYFVEEAQIYGN